MLWLFVLEQGLAARHNGFAARRPYVDITNRHKKIASDLSDRVLSDVQTGIGKTRTLLYWSSRQANHEDFFNFKENDWFHFSYKDRWQLQYLAQHHAVSL